MPAQLISREEHSMPVAELIKELEMKPQNLRVRMRIEPDDRYVGWHIKEVYQEEDNIVLFS